MLRIGNLNVEVDDHDPQHKVLRGIYGIASEPSKDTPGRIARRFLRTVAPSLGLRPDLADLKFDPVKHSILGSHVLCQQKIWGQLATDAWVKVSIDKQGRVFHVVNTCHPSTVPAEPEKRILSKQQSKQIALRIAMKKARAITAKVLEQKRATYPQKRKSVRLTPAWKLVVQTKKPAREYRIYLDAHTGKCLDIYDQVKRVNAAGLVFYPNPVVTLDDTTLRDNSSIPLDVYRPVRLRNLKRGGRLDGRWVSTANTPNRVRRTDGKFLFHRKQNGFTEVMVYYHIDRAHRYIQELGFSNVMNHPIKVNAKADTDDSSYWPEGRTLCFLRAGDCDPADAEDADIILHEYGHAIQDDQVRGFGRREGQAAAMGEGFGDYLAASYFASVKSARLQTKVMTWGKVPNRSAEPPMPRRVDRKGGVSSTKVSDPYCGGELWSACLWELRSRLGGRTADRLAIAHHFLLSREATFEDAANAIVTADQVLNHGRNCRFIRRVFRGRGIFRSSKRKNPTGQVHDDGGLWSTCRHELYIALGRKAANQLLTVHRRLLADRATINDAANALVTTDQLLNHGQNVQHIRRIFRRHGIFTLAAAQEARR